eukprot:351074-Chlamydomonas_euryale.AAC.1
MEGLPEQLALGECDVARVKVRGSVTNDAPPTASLNLAYVHSCVHAFASTPRTRIHTCIHTLPPRVRASLHASIRFYPAYAHPYMHPYASTP